MGPFWALALQVAAAAASAPAAIPRIDFDLGEVEPFDPAAIRTIPVFARDCGAAQGDEILVCGRRGADPQGRYRTGPLLPDPPTAMDELSASLSTTIGPFRLGSMKQADGTYSFGVGLKF